MFGTKLFRSTAYDAIALTTRNAAMKTRLLKSKVFFLILGIGLTTSIFAQSTWRYAGNYDAVLGLFDDQHFVVDDGNRDYKFSTDGGATLQNLGLSVTSPKSIIGVEYLSVSRLRAIVFTGSNLEIHESLDGGLTFSQLGNVFPTSMAVLNIAPQMVSFDANESLLQTKVLYNSQLIPVLFRTLDGGATWNIATTDTFAFVDLYSMSIYPDGHIAAISNLPQGVELSTDKGQSFTATAAFPPLNSSVKIAFDGGQNIWITDVAGSQNADCYYSADGGATWQAWLTAEDAMDLKYTNPSNIMLWGTDDTTALSVDGGNTFNTVHFPADKPLGSLLRLQVGGNDQCFYISDGSAKLWIYDLGASIGFHEKSIAGDLSLYPNPAKDHIVLSGLSSDLSSFKLEIQGFDGRNYPVSSEMLSKDRISIQDLEAGIYLLRISSKEGGHQSLTFIKR